MCREIQLARNRSALGLDGLRDQFPQHNLFGEILRADDDDRA